MITEEQMKLVFTRTEPERHVDTWRDKLWQVVFTIVLLGFLAAAIGPFVVTRDGVDGETGCCAPSDVR
jgi:hypothetical protein